MADGKEKQESPTTQHSEDELQALLKELGSLEKSLFPESDGIVDGSSNDSDVDGKYAEEIKSAQDLLSQIKIVEELVKSLQNREKANKGREFLSKLKIFEGVKLLNDSEVIHLMGRKDKVEKVENLYLQALDDKSKEGELIAFINNPENGLYSIREYIDEYRLLSQMYLRSSRKDININNDLLNNEDYPEVKGVFYKYGTINDGKTKQLLSSFVEQTINSPNRNIDSLKEFINKNVDNFFTLENVGDYFNITDIFILLQSFIVRSKESYEEQEKEYNKIIDFSELFEKAEKINSIKENYEKIVKYYEGIGDDNTLQGIKEVIKPKKEEGGQKKDLGNAIDGNMQSMLQVIQRYGTKEALGLENQETKKSEIPKDLEQKHGKQVKELIDAGAKIDQNGNLSINTPINLGVNGSIEMGENGELIYMSSLGYNFKFDKDLNKSGDKIFEIKEQMDFLDKVGFGFFGNNFRTMIETIQGSSLITSNVGISIREGIGNENDFLSMPETIHICNIFKKIGFLGNEINPNNLTNPTMTRGNFVEKTGELSQKYGEDSFYNESGNFSKIAFERVIVKEFSNKK